MRLTTVGRGGLGDGRGATGCRIVAIPETPGAGPLGAEAVPVAVQPA